MINVAYLFSDVKMREHDVQINLVSNCEGMIFVASVSVCGGFVI